MLALGTTAWAGGVGAARVTSHAKRTVITLEGNTGVSFTKNFNPFDAASFVTSMSVRSLSYEPLLEFNLLGSQVHDWLATGYKFSDSGKALTFTLRKGVKWSDGKPFTARDVAFTFNLIKANPSANYAGIPPMSRRATTSGNKVTLHFKQAVYTALPAIGGNTYIVAAHIWKSIKHPATATVVKPVGTGPYVLRSYSSQVVKYTANSRYWGGRPPISEVNVPSYADNSAASNALASGQLTWAGNDIPNIKSVFVNRDRKTNHYFFAPGSTVTLFFNVANGGPLASAAVRKAISYGVNRDKLSTVGETGYEKPATSSSGLILPNQKQYLVKSDTRDLPGRPDKSKVYSILRKAGYKKDSHGIWAKNGKEISFSIEDPTAYSDYYEDSKLICAEMKAVSIGCTVDGVATSQWYSDLPSGHFQAAIHWGSGGISPFVQYQNWLDYTLSAPIGSSATADYGRYHTTAAQRALRAMESTNPSNTTAITKDVHKLAGLFSSQVPDAPLLYGADWDEYSTAHFTGFVTPQNPYMDPSPGDPQLPYILMHLKVKK